MSPALVLASGSARRHALLREAGVAYEIRVSDVDETVEPGTAPEDAAVGLARKKARAVAEGLAGEPRWVLGADTVVAVTRDGVDHLLEKPRDADDARRMLRWLSESRHRVITGVCVERCSDGVVATDYERTWVTMRAITEAEVEAYVASGEWQGKAGGYAIQENADAFVTRLEEGGFDNVVGLPVALTLRLLEELALPV